MARGEIGEARAELERAESSLGHVSTIVLLQACCAVRDGRVPDALRAFDGLRSAYDRGEAGADDVAMLAAVLGDWTSARKWLAEACTQRAPFLGYVEVEPAMAPLLDDPECRALLRRHGFSV